MPPDEIVGSVGSDDDQKTADGGGDLFDFTTFGFDGVDGTQIDAGVTSGADSSEWDPISVDSDGSSKDGDSAKCSGEGSAASSTGGSPPACGVKQQ